MSSFTISMRTSGKKLAGNNYRKYYANEETSKAASSSMNQNGFLVSSNKRLYLKPGYRMKRACEGNNILNGKPIETLHKKSNYSLGRYESSFMLKEKGTCLTQREDSKNLSGRAEKKLGKRRRWKIKKKTVEQDGVSLMKRRTRYLLIKLKLEQNLIDAYSADGWKGQSREKIKPEKELQRAQRQILKCKLGIRDSIHQLDLIGSEGRIEDSVMLPDGSVFHEHIFCAKCKSREAFPDNDIILCDGNCNCGFHQKCLEPPLEKIPPGDQGWLCNICDCKVEILETINAHLGTCFTVNSSWEDIFKEAMASPDTERRCPNTAEDWPSDDSEDEDYCPDNTINKTEFEENVSDDTCSSNDLICLSDASLNSTYLSSGEFSDHEITNNRRKRRDVDYQKLYDEMFGKEPNEVEEESEDEDWGPYSRRRRRIASNAGITTTDGEDKVGHEKMASQKRSSCNRRSFFRIPPDAIEKLRQAFAQNELPSRTVKENLSKQLGISSAKVDKWFKNARYAALKLRKADVSNISAVNERHRHTSEEAVSLDNISLLPLASIFNLLRLKKKNRQRENLVPLKRATITVSSGEILVGPRLENAARFEKNTNATNTELPSMKTTDDVSQSEQFFINEIKRLWILEWRLHCLKQQLSACKDGNQAPIESHSGGGVIYVPVAEVKEKASGCKIITS